LEKISAAGFYFAKNNQRDLNVPVGIISSSWGGSRIEPWTPVEGYTALAAFITESEKMPVMIDSVVPGKDYKSMILPLAPFALKGFLWYQGESNCMQNETVRYADKMQALVESWRKQWDDNKLPFISVAIAPYYYTKRKDHVPHTPETLPEFWEGQWLSLQIANTWMIVVTDLVDKLSEIHPSYKWEVGRRLSLVAMNKVYGKKNTVYSGPEYKSMKVKNEKAILTFSNTDGLKSNDGAPLNWFEIAGEDGKFLPATAIIDRKNIIISNNSITKPVNVRFAWNETAQPNLFNGAGLPAVPFRTNPQRWEYKK
jgi:sialate O-acetylesterase